MTYWDEKMKGIWSGLIIPPYIGIGSEANHNKRVDYHWQPPDVGWYKLNFDGASRGNPGVAGIGFSILNWEGREITLKSHPIGHKTNNWAELAALLEGLKICKVLEVEKLEIEGDSAIIIKAFRKGSMPNWRLNALLARAISLRNFFRRLTVNHIFREGNKRVDELANMGADGKELP
ncbi:uncharacterized protein LOC131875073 [Cryptomeria japonica]|uniref:uncharacterized protein LOC131875073 n=1 Tax=Cryptomeria japonica TaxID=3369 RepID=UPI0027DA8C8A|nr:uncharacterized protein LOC131875073 [Cryptomeria japonica]